MLQSFFVFLLGSIIECLPLPLLFSRGKIGYQVKRRTDHLHVYVPQNNCSRPVIAFVHGGDGVSGTIFPPHEANGTPSYAHIGERFASNGFEIGLIGYMRCKVPTEVWEKMITGCILASATLAIIALMLTAVCMPAGGLIYGVFVAFVVYAISLTVFGKISYRWYSKYLPEGTTLAEQVATVWTQLQHLHDFCGRRPLVVVGHDHGALLASLALGEHKPDFVCTFIGVAGIYDPRLLRDSYQGVWRKLLDAFYLKPVFGGTDDQSLPVAAPPSDKTSVILISGRGESMPMRIQAHKFLAQLPAKTSGWTIPVGFGSDMALMLCTQTCTAIQLAVHTQYK